MVSPKHSLACTYGNHHPVILGWCDKLLDRCWWKGQYGVSYNSIQRFGNNRIAAEHSRRECDTHRPITEPEVFYFDVPLSDGFQDYIRAKCIEYDVPMELVIALIDKESSFRSDVVSKTNDYGYMQINKCNHEWLSETLGVSNFLDPYENVFCGIYIISGHLEKTDGNIELALMRYNCGATGARRLWEQGTYSTSYSRSVMTLYESYKEEAANGAGTP